MKPHRPISLRPFIPLSLFLITSIPSAHAQTFTPLGPQVTVASGVSTDGRTVVGLGGSDPFYRAVKWVDGVVTQLPIGPDDTISYAYAIDEGHIVGGSGRMIVIFDRLEAVRWSGPGSTMTRLGVLPGTSSSVARAVADNGNTVVGMSTSPTEFGLMDMQAFRWKPTTGMVRLAPAPGFDWAAAFGHEGFTVGYSRTSGTGSVTQHATTWNFAGAPTDLGVPAGYTSSAGMGHGPGGSPVAQVSGASGTTLARHVSGVWEVIPPPAPYTTLFFGGASTWLIVGTASSGTPESAVYLDRGSGLINMQDYLLSKGVTAVAGWTRLRGMGTAGRHVVGVGVNPATGQQEGWRVTLPQEFFGGCRVNCNGDLTPDGGVILDIRDFVCFQNKFAVGDLYADFTRDGRLDIQDFSAFQNLFALGCGPS